jgi:hypothetical protein
MIATAIVTAETTAATTMMTATTAAITVIETAFATLAGMLGTALVLPLPFRTGTVLRTAVFTTIVTAITTATTTAAIILAATVSTAIASFIATTLARTFVLTWSGSSWSLLGGVAAEETFQPTEKARFLGFGDGGRGLRLKRAWLFTALVELFFAFAERLFAFTREFTAGFARAKLVTWLTRLLVAGRALITANGHLSTASLGLTVGKARRMKVRAAFATGIGAGSGLFRLTTDLPALGRTGFLLWRENLEFGFGLHHRFGSGGEGFYGDRSCNRCNGGDRGWVCRSELLCGHGHDGRLDFRHCFNRSGNGRGCERIDVFGLVVNDLDGGRLIAADGSIFVCSGGGRGRTGALAARQA